MRERIEEYVILCCDGVHELQINVNKKLSEDIRWKPFGDIKFADGFVFQVMIRTES